MSVTSEGAEHEDSPQLKAWLEQVRHKWAATEEAGDAPGAPEEDAPPVTDAPPDVEATDDVVDDEPETYPRAHVKELRQENRRYRERAQAAEQLAEKHASRLHTELVRATGKLADPTDLPFDESHLEDSDALKAAVEDLLTTKPHLARRTPTGDIGQGRRGSAPEPVNLLQLLKDRT